MSSFNKSFKYPRPPKQVNDLGIGLEIEGGLERRRASDNVEVFIEKRVSRPGSKEDPVGIPQPHMEKNFEKLLSDTFNVTRQITGFNTDKSSKMDSKGVTS